MTTLRRQLREQYVTNMIQAYRYSVDLRAEFLHFRQPAIYDGASWSQYETGMMEKQGYPGGEVAFQNGNPELTGAVPELRSSLILSTDLNGIFSGQQPSVFLDFCHVAHHGNRIAAEHIFSVLSARLKSTD